MKEKWISAYMDIAERFSQLSSARRLKVGSVIVKDHRIISIGYNGQPAGWDNNCEDKVYATSECDLSKFPYSDEKGHYTLKTQSSVVHAEANAIMKLARDGESGQHSTLFCTHAPCIDCAKMIYGAGIGTVFYRNVYRDELGLEFLQRGGVTVLRHENQAGANQS